MARHGNSQRFPLTRAKGAAFLVLGILASAAWQQGFGTPTPPSGVDLAITDARTCAAVAAYNVADHDTGLQAAFVSVALNQARSTTPPDCASGLVAVMANGLDQVRWQRALDLVDGVMSGDYPLGLGACARATEVIPPASDLPYPSRARAQCVISGYAFVGGEP
jgi:hypothetical protein